MRCNNAPSIFGPHPGLTLAAAVGAAVADELGVGCGEFSAVGGDASFAQHACQSGRAAAGAEVADRFKAIEVFGGAVAKRVWAVPKQLIQYSHVIRDQRFFVAFKSSSYFYDNKGLVDFVCHQLIFQWAAGLGLLPVPLTPP